MSINAIQLKTDEIYALFQPVEGLNTVYYGNIGQGKTRNATADIIELCNRGEIVYANWQIDIKDFDERKDLRTVWSKFLGGRNLFYEFKKENFHYIEPQKIIDNVKDNNIEFFSQLVGVHLFLDEGQWIFNSLERYDPSDPDMVSKLKLVLHGRHYCRTLNVLTQRAVNINKNIRSQVSIWYRCVKRLEMFGYIIFERWAIQEMKDDMPVEYTEKRNLKLEVVRQVPNGDRKTYFVHKKSDLIFPSYNTHGMRAKGAIEQVPKFDAYEVDFRGRLSLLLALMFPRVVRFIRTARGRIASLRVRRAVVDKSVDTVIKKSTFPIKIQDIRVKE